MNPKLNTFFIIAMLLFSMLIVQAVAPIKYYEINSDVELRGAIFVNVDPSSFYASYNNGTIQIDSSEHFENVQIKFKGIAINARLKNYNGFNVGYTHIANDGTTTNEIKPLEIDGQGFAYLTTDFSTVIINGMTGTTTQTFISQNGNHSFNVPDGSSYNISITNNQIGVWTSSDGKNYQNKSVITINGSMVTTQNDIPLQLYINMDGVNVSGDIGVAYTNLTAIPREIEYIWNNETVSLFFPYNTISGINSEFVVLWGADNTTEPAANSIYGSEAVWASTYKAVWNMNNDPNGDAANSIKDSTGNGHHGTPVGSMTTADLVDSAYGKALDFDGGDDRIDIDGSASESDFDFSTDNFSVMVFIDYDSLKDYDIPIGAWSVSSNIGNWRIYSDSYSTFGTTVSGTGNEEIAMETGVQMLSFSRISGTVYKYRNAVAKNSYSASGDASATHDIQLGGGYISGYFSLDGRIIQARIMDSGFSANYISTTSKNLNNPTATDINSFYLTIGETQTGSGSSNITTSIIGDSNTQLYNTSETKTFVLSSMNSTNYINTTTSCIDYDITIITYWTDDTTLQSETATAGYAKQYINYTPSGHNVTADLNTTFTFDFTAQDYIGTATSTLNNVSKTTTRDGQDVNASVGELIAGTPYWWNVTVLYNNIFTLSNQSDQTAYLGISKAFTDSTYNDPDNNPIATRLWNFGDGDTSGASNPTHTYTSLGNLNANYTVIEDATTNSQSITKEFNVSVVVQPVQDLITEHLDQTWIKFNWSDYDSADLWNVFELEESAPYSTATFILDGIKDDAYNTDAHAFVLSTPNPVSDLNYETVYWLRTDDNLTGYADGFDADTKSNDDYFKIGIDNTGNGLTNDDRLYKLNEDGTVKAERWTGTQWIPIATNAQGVVVGAGGNGAIQYEMIIPLSELAGFVNGVTSRFMMERECNDLVPTVETFYPTNLINDTDGSLWANATLTATPVYNYIGNTSISEFNSTGLTPYTWYRHQFVTVNGSTNSTPIYSDDITEDVPHYSVSGYILDSITGNGIAGANVWSQNGFVGEITQSDANGFYEGYNFHSANYSIYANVTGYAETHIDIIVSGNLTNQNVTMTAFEMTDWMLWAKLLEIEALLDIEETAPTEITKMTYQIFILLIIIDLLAVWYSFTHIDKSYYTDVITSLLSVIISAIVAYNSVIGVSYYFATQSTVHEIEYTSISLMILFSSVSLVMLIFFIAKILELTHKELE